MKAAVSVGLLWFLLGFLQDADVGTHFERVPVSAFVIASLLLMLQGLILALRWQQVLGILDSHIPLDDLVRTSFIGLFFNQALPSSIGGSSLTLDEDTEPEFVLVQMTDTQNGNYELYVLLFLVMVTTITVLAFKNRDKIVSYAKGRL